MKVNVRVGRDAILAALTCAACACGRLSFDPTVDAPPVDDEGGDLDLGFGIDGVAPVAPFMFMRVTAVAVQGQQIIVGGFSGPTLAADGAYGFTLTRLAPDGSIDPSFGTAGSVQTVSGTNSKLWAVHVYTDGRILGAGYGVSGSFDYMIARYLPTGALDLSFSGDGKYIGVGPVASSLANNRLFGMAVRADGRVNGAGFTEWFGPPRYEQTSLVRIGPNGSLDLAFNATGYVVNPMSLPMTNFSRATDLVLDASENLIVVGSSQASDLDFAVIKLSATGTLDPSFGSGGVVTTAIAAGSTDAAETIVAASDGGYVVGGTSSNQIAIAKYRADGALDSAFGANGVLVSQFPGTNTLEKLVVIPDGRMFGVGGVVGDGSNDCVLYLITENGRFDPGFGVGGRERLHFGDAGADSACTAAVVQPDGAVVAAGNGATAAAPEAMFVVRLLF